MLDSFTDCGFKKSLKDFINQDLKVFSNLDNVRSIPSIIDGFKDSQRKAVYGMILHGNSEIKVAQLAGAASLCLHEDTLVLVGNSYFKIKDLYNLFHDYGSFDITSYDENLKAEVLDECIDVIYKGETTEFVEIEFENGDCIELTPTHKVLTERGWISAKDIMENDNIVSI